MDEFCLFYPEGHEAHCERGHPERPERIEIIRLALQETGVWNRLKQLAPIEVPRFVLESTHTPEYLSLLERSCRRGGHLDADTYVTPASWNLAHLSAGGAAAVSDSIWRRESKSGLALCRPPGHHAMRSQGMGFCLLNNIALATEYLLQIDGVERVAIVDLDLHHGNGTQDIFWRRKEVLFISTHQRPLYPGTGALQEQGEGEGFGYTANFPLAPGSGDRAYHTVMDELILPLLTRFKPEIILVSYGYDAHWSDPLGYLLLTAEGLAELVRKLMMFAEKNCSGRVSLILEGGYSLEAATACTVGIVKTLLGEPWTDPLGPAPYQETENWVSMVREAKLLWDL